MVCSHFNKNDYSTIAYNKDTQDSFKKSHLPFCWKVARLFLVGERNIKKYYFYFSLKCAFKLRTTGLSIEIIEAAIMVTLFFHFYLLI